MKTLVATPDPEEPTGQTYYSGGCTWTTSFINSVTWNGTSTMTFWTQ